MRPSVSMKSVTSVTRRVADGARGVESLGGVRRWHPDVGDHQLRCGLAHHREQLRAVAGLPDNGKAREVQQAGQPRTQQHIILGHHDPNWTRMLCSRSPVLGVKNISDVGGYSHVVDR
jgi:hypothetical protein